MAEDKEKNEEFEVESSEAVEANSADTQETSTMGSSENIDKELQDLKDELENQKKEYMFLLAEFDNFRKRTLREKAELIKNAGEKAMKDILPVIDDFERAKDAAEKTEDVESLKEGISLIYSKFIKYLESNGVKPIDSDNKEFDTEFHEAVTTFPTDDESKKGKVIDTVLKGYMMNDKVLRHSKVVVGQ